MFTLEVMIKVLGLGVAGYFHSSLNIRLHRNIRILDRSWYHIRQVLRLERDLSVRSEDSTTFKNFNVSKSQRRNLESAAAVFKLLLTRYSLIVGIHIFERDSLNYLTHKHITGILLVLRLCDSQYDDVSQNSFNNTYSRSSYVDSGYALNFENIGSSFMVLFFICIGNNWPLTGRCYRRTGSYWCRSTLSFGTFFP